jgi:hypothetical protein
VAHAHVASVFGHERKREHESKFGNT